MKIKVLGSNCKSCEALARNVQEAIKKSEINATFEKVTDIQEIVSYGVITIPALVVDAKVKSIGKVLSVKQILELL